MTKCRADFATELEGLALRTCAKEEALSETARSISILPSPSFAHCLNVSICFVLGLYDWRTKY